MSGAQGSRPRKKGLKMPRRWKVGRIQLPWFQPACSRELVSGTATEKQQVLRRTPRLQLLEGPPQSKAKQGFFYPNTCQSPANPFCLLREFSKGQLCTCCVLRKTERV